MKEANLLILTILLLFGQSACSTSPKFSGLFVMKQGGRLAT